MCAVNTDSVIIHVNCLSEQMTSFQSGVTVSQQGTHVWDSNHVKLPHLNVSTSIYALSKDHHRFYIKSFSEQVTVFIIRSYSIIIILHSHRLNPPTSPNHHPLTGMSPVVHCASSPKEITLLGMFRYCNNNN